MSEEYLVVTIVVLWLLGGIVCLSWAADMAATGNGVRWWRVPPLMALWPILVVMASLHWVFGKVVEIVMGKSA